MRSTHPLMLLVLAALTGCGARPAGDGDAQAAADDQRRPAVIVFHGDTAAIEAPESVAANEPFTVRVTSFGGGCVRETAEPQVESRDGVIEIRPHHIDTGGEVCTMDLLFLTHAIEVTAPRPGPAVLRVIGTRRDADAPDGTETRLERAIVVR